MQHLTAPMFHSVASHLYCHNVAHMHLNHPCWFSVFVNQQTLVLIRKAASSSLPQTDTLQTFKCLCYFVFIVLKQKSIWQAHPIRWVRRSGPGAHEHSIKRRVPRTKSAWEAAPKGCTWAKGLLWVYSPTSTQV